MATGIGMMDSPSLSASFFEIPQLLSVTIAVFIDFHIPLNQYPKKGGVHKGNKGALDS